MTIRPRSWPVQGAALFLCLLSATPAAAHKLRLFATVDEGAITGYAFFIGGGRAMGTDWWATDANGQRVAEGITDDQGRYRFAPPQTSDITVHVDTHEGHMAQAVIKADRVIALSPTASPGFDPTLSTQSLTQTRSSQTNAEQAALVARAVQHAVDPLMERIDAMDARMRITDVISGLFLIIGLAGIGLYVRSKRQGGGPS